jgi:hypothetical protein
VREEEHAGHGIIKFAAIVALNALDGGAELRADVRKKMDKVGKSFRFKAKRKSPNVV